MTASLRSDSGLLVLHFTPILHKLTDEDFFELCRVNPDVRLERTAEGDLIIMPPTGGETGNQNFTLAGLFSTWVDEDGTGVAFDSSTGFRLPNGAIRSPDLSWVRQDCWRQLSPKERKGFVPLCPDFVIELRSPTDSLDDLHAKMQEYIDNGAELGWLIDPLERKVHIYSPSTKPVCLDNPATVSGNPVLPRFELKMSRLWENVKR
jgi:Uma2 family endonuclease